MIFFRQAVGMGSIDDLRSSALALQLVGRHAGDEAVGGTVLAWRPQTIITLKKQFKTPKPAKNYHTSTTRHFKPQQPPIKKQWNKQINP